MQKTIVRHLHDIDPKLIQFNESTKPANGLIRIAFPTYEGELGERERLVIQLPVVQISNPYYGIPRLDRFHTEEQRNYIKLPYDKDTMGILQKIDEKLNCISFKQIMFGDKWSKYSYSPLVQTPEGKIPYIKLKLDTDPDSNDILTRVYTTKWEKKEEVEISGIDDLALLVCYKSQVRCIVKATKLWIQQPQANAKYGLTLKVVKILVEEEGEEEEKKDDLDFI